MIGLLLTCRHPCGRGSDGDEASRQAARRDLFLGRRAVRPGVCAWRELSAVPL